MNDQIQGADGISNAPSITVLLTAHHEGALLLPTLRSVDAACEHARAAGIYADVLIVMDKPNQQTEFVAKTFVTKAVAQFSIVVVDCGCPALARNIGIRSISSDFVAIQDGDDLVSSNWLAEGVGYQLSLAREGAAIIAHPEWNMTFGGDNVIMKHPCMLSDKTLSLGNLMYENYWTALAIASTKIFKSIQYRSNKSSKVFGYEDWDWNLRCLEIGAIHTRVPNTFHFVRRKHAGVSYVERNQARIVRPAEFFTSRAYFGNKVGASAYEASADATAESFDDKAYQIAHEDIKIGVESGYFSSGREHYDKYGKNEGRIAFPSGVFAELVTQAKFEYALFPDSALLCRYTRYDPAKLNRKTEEARALMKQLKYLILTKTKLSHFSHVVAAPWVQRGGADLALLFHLEYLVKTNQSVLLVLTENRDSAWIAKVPKQVAVLNLGQIAKESTRIEKRNLFFYILSAAKAQLLHIINSEAAWDALVEYGDAIKATMSVVASLYCYDYTRDGKPVGYSACLQRCAEYVDLIYSDHQDYLSHLIAHYGISPSKVLALNHPIAKEVGAETLYDAKVNRVLWASRLDRQKRPDVLLAIAKECPEFEFYIFGDHLLDSSEIDVQLGQLSNVKLMGGFDGFSSLAISKYFAFLYTSQWDGLPNILLEAAVSGLPIVAPAIGGITGFLSDGRGFLCSHTEAVDEYIDCLHQAFENAQEAKGMVKRMRKYVETSHSYSRFFDQLNAAKYSLVAD